MIKSKGFTLIEVLIAAVIMFSALSITAFVFSSARLSSQQAEQNITLLAPLPFIVDTIRAQIRQNPSAELHGDGAFQGVNFRWQAQAMHFLPPPAQFIVESGEFLEYEARFYLYEVSLELEYRNRRRTFEFQEVAWLEESRLR